MDHLMIIVYHTSYHTTIISNMYDKFQKHVSYRSSKIAIHVNG